MDKTGDWGPAWCPQQLQSQSWGGILSHVGPATVHLCTPHIWNPRDWIQAPALPFTESVAAGRLPPPEALLPHLQLSITLCSGNKHRGLSLPEAEPETRILCKWVTEGSCPGERRESNRGGVSAGDSLTGSCREIQSTSPSTHRPRGRQESAFCLPVSAGRWLWSVQTKRQTEGGFPGKEAAVSISSQHWPQLRAGSTSTIHKVANSQMC